MGAQAGTPRPSSARLFAFWALLAISATPAGGPGARQTVNHHHCLPGPSLAHTLKGKGKNLPALAPPPASREAGAGEEKGGLYAHRQEGTTSPPSPPTVPSGERRLCEAPETGRSRHAAGGCSAPGGGAQATVGEASGPKDLRKRPSGGRKGERTHSHCGTRKWSHGCHVLCPHRP